MKTKSISSTSTLGIFSPSEPITKDRREKFEKGLQVLIDKGYKYILTEGVFNSHHYMAGSVKQRIDDIHGLLNCSEVDALLASLGGKSCNQLLPELDFELIKHVKKPILAFSDGCVLLNAITEITGLFTYHGPNVAGRMFETKHSDLKLLHQNSNFDTKNLLGDISSSEVRVIKPGTAQGQLFGGNLNTFVLGLVGSKYMPSFKNGILFWESLNERPQIIHQFLMCLRNSGLFDRLDGMVIGDFITNEPLEYKQYDSFDMIKDVTKEYSFPIVYARTFGHPDGMENPIIPIGPVAELSTNNVTLKLCEEVVS